MAVRGSLREARLADVLQLLALGQKTGCLSLTDGVSSGSVYLDHGRISHATVDKRRDRLGGLPAGDEVVAPGELDHHAREQVEEAVYTLFTWTTGTFSFSPHVRPEEGAVLVSLDVERVLLEGARRVDERARFELVPADLRARFDLGLIELRAGRPRAALPHFRAVVEGGGAWGSVFHDISLALESLGLLDDALLALEEAHRLLGNHPPVLLSRAILLAKTGRIREAAEGFATYRARLDEGGAAPAVYYAFAMLTEGACGRLASAWQLAEEGVRHHPRVAPVLLHAAGVRERMGMGEEAEMLYRRARALDPGKGATWRAITDR